MSKNKFGEIQKIGVDAEGLEIFRARVEVGLAKSALRKGSRFANHDEIILRNLIC